MGEGSSIDFEEPVVITIQCDSDGWVMQVDKLLYITLNFEDVLVMCTNGVGVVAKDAPGERRLAIPPLSPPS